MTAAERVVMEALEAAEYLCDHHMWRDIPLELEEVTGICWYKEATREQIVIALCLLAAIVQQDIAQQDIAEFFV
jgi:hypothetical protein